jgi:hypothetical protein
MNTNWCRNHGRRHLYYYFTATNRDKLLFIIKNPSKFIKCPFPEFGAEFRDMREFIAPIERTTSVDQCPRIKVIANPFTGIDGTAQGVSRDMDVLVRITSRRNGLAHITVQMSPKSISLSTTTIVPSTTAISSSRTYQSYWPNGVS